MLSRGLASVLRHAGWRSYSSQQAAYVVGVPRCQPLLSLMFGEKLILRLPTFDPVVRARVGRSDPSSATSRSARQTAHLISARTHACCRSSSEKRSLGPIVCSLLAPLFHPPAPVHPAGPRCASLAAGPLVSTRRRSCSKRRRRCTLTLSRSFPSPMDSSDLAWPPITPRSRCVLRPHGAL